MHRIINKAIYGLCKIIIFFPINCNYYLKYFLLFLLPWMQLLFPCDLFPIFLNVLYFFRLLNISIKNIFYYHFFLSSSSFILYKSNLLFCYSIRSTFAFLLSLSTTYFSFFSFFYIYSSYFTSFPNFGWFYYCNYLYFSFICSISSLRYFSFKDYLSDFSFSFCFSISISH